MIRRRYWTSGLCFERNEKDYLVGLEYIPLIEGGKQKSLAEKKYRRRVNEKIEFITTQE